MIDQLRGDMPELLGERLDGGYRRLLDEGLVFTNARYEHLTTYTAVGHATVFTGLEARDHGIVGNTWLERSDDGLRLVWAGDRCAERPDEKEVRGPGYLRAPTFGDRLIRAGRLGRVYGLSTKPRAAVVMAGHEGVALWYEKHTGHLRTSACYEDRDPDLAGLVAAVDGDPGSPGRLRADGFRHRVWDTLHDITTYRAFCAEGAADCFSSDPHEDRVFHDEAGRPDGAFPYAVSRPPEGGDADDHYYPRLRSTPFADEMIVSAAETLVRERGLGRAARPDLLALNLASLDYAGHSFGPDSVEYEDVFYRLDRLLGRLLRFLDDEVGEGRYVVVLSSDHGVDSIPAHRRAQGLPAGKHGDYRELTALANGLLRERLGVDRDLVGGFTVPWFYLDLQAVTAAGLEREAVERALADAFAAREGFARTFTRTELDAGAADPGNRILDAVLRSWVPDRSGDVALVQAEHWYLDTVTYDAAMHGSPYAYDTWVPVIVHGPGIAPGAVDRRISPRQVADTVLSLLDPAAPAPESLLP